VPTAPFAWTHEKTRVEYDDGTLSIDDKRFSLDEVERMMRCISVSTDPGSWNRLECRVRLFVDGEVVSVGFRGDASTEEWGPWRPLWEQFDALVAQEIEPRLLERTIRRAKDGSPAEIGSIRARGRGRLTVTPESLQARTNVSRPSPWKPITALSDGVLKITTTGPDGKQRTHLTGLGEAEWDAWQIPHLWRHFGAP
jgi:hypothetical protein